MNIGKTPTSSILTINGQLLQAFLLVGAAWRLWPSSPKWWGLGMVSAVLAMGAFGKTIEALRSMAKLYSREKNFAHLAATSRAPDPSDLADQDALKNAGMIDD